jgi:hypothetical protein
MNGSGPLLVLGRERVGVSEGSGSSVMGVEVSSAASGTLVCDADVFAAKKPLRDCCPFVEVCELELPNVDLLLFTGLAGDVVLDRRFVEPFNGLVRTDGGLLLSTEDAAVLVGDWVPSWVELAVGSGGGGVGVGFFANISLMLLLLLNSGRRFPDVGRWSLGSNSRSRSPFLKVPGGFSISTMWISSPCHSTTSFVVAYTGQ